MTRDIFSKNADYQKFEVLKSNRNKRHRYGEFFVEGVRNLNQARENGWEFAAFLYARDRALSRWAQEMLEQVPAPIHYRLAGELLDSLSGKEDGSELMAVVKMRKDGAQLLRRPANPLWVLFDRPSNRGNLGSLLRSCDGLGADGLILTGHGVDLYDPEVVTASMGSFFRVPAVQLENSQAAAFLAAMREEYPGFRYREVIPVETRFTLSSPRDIGDLYRMTPYFWKTPKAGAERLSRLETLAVTGQFRIHVMEREK